MAREDRPRRLEGVVELSNAQGSVTVRQGEGAVASIGQAPTKFVLVNSNDREQMLFYLTLRDAFNWLPASPNPEKARATSAPGSNAFHRTREPPMTG